MDTDLDYTPGCLLLLIPPVVLFFAAAGFVTLANGMLGSSAPMSAMIAVLVFGAVLLYCLVRVVRKQDQIARRRIEEQAFRDAHLEQARLHKIEMAKRAEADKQRRLDEAARWEADRKRRREEAAAEEVERQRRIAERLEAERAAKRRLAEEERRRLEIYAAYRASPRSVSAGAVSTPQEAETMAVIYAQLWGFDDAHETPPGADGGIDVLSKDIAGQVKFLTSSPVGRPAVQQLVGAALPLGLFPVFWSYESYSSSAYSKQAVEYANASTVALFAFDSRGHCWPVNQIARRLVNRVPATDDQQ